MTAVTDFEPGRQTASVRSSFWHRFALLLAAMSLFAEAEKDQPTEYTYLGPGPVGAYDRALLELALEKTREHYGDFRVRYAPPMSEDRARKIVREQNYTRPIRSDVPHPEVIGDRRLRYVPVPMYFGILGYRVCFVTKAVAESFSRATDLSALTRFTFGQGIGWRDVEVLEANGLRVLKAPTADNLYRMLEAGRIEVFCRGVNEVLNEYEMYQDMRNIVLDTHIAFYYPLPLFFYVNAEDKATHQRLHEGVIAAYQDGSMRTLWKQHFEASVNHTQLGKRTILSLKNSIMDALPFDYSEYLYRPDDESW